MSGDVQPRKRKDKKRKREEDESSHGVHITKMGNEDVHLHVHHEHGTGGHWCAKVFFFTLLTILLGLIALIILENRGLSDLDTPLSESRFSNYFDGWVDEHRVEHEEHDPVQASIEEHDEHDEPFEEVEDHDDDEDEDHQDKDEDEDDDGDEDDEETATKEDEDEEEDDPKTAESLPEDDDDDDDDDDKYEGKDNDANDDDENLTKENTAAENLDDEDEDENDQDDDDEENDNESQPQTAEDDDNNDDEENITPVENDDDEDVSANDNQNEKENTEDDNDEDEEDDEDDEGFESIEKVVDNDAEELKLLQEKARKIAAANGEEVQENPDDDDEEADKLADGAPSWASSQIKPKESIGGGPQNMDELDPFEEELRRANEEILRQKFNNALQMLTMLSQKYPGRPEVYLEKAKCLDKFSEKEKSNHLLREAINTYKQYMSFETAIRNDTQFKMAGERCIDRMRFIGFYVPAISIHKLLIKRFENEPYYRNELSITLLMANRIAEVKQNAQEILKLWPNNGLALVHFGYTLKQLQNDYHNAIPYLRKGIESKEPGTQEGFFYFNLGEALQRLGRQEEALEVYQKGADMKLFPSAYQRSLYNVNDLKAQPFWLKKETTYLPFFNNLERNWEAIRMEGLNLLKRNGFFMDEAENLRDTGDWKQFDLYARGQKKAANCQKAPITCSLIEDFRAAKSCTRGQVKFSVMHPGTHVWPHCGPTNCRLRAHLGLVVPEGTFLRVANITRTWKEGKFLIFDDSFEHEVWHNGTSLRLVLIVDVWHPELTQHQKQSLSPI